MILQVNNVLIIVWTNKGREKMEDFYLLFAIMTMGKIIIIKIKKKSVLYREGKPEIYVLFYIVTC